MNPRHLVIVLTLVTSGSACAASVARNDIFKTSSTTTNFLFDDGTNTVAIGTVYETGNLVGVNATLARFTSAATGLTEAGNGDITISFDELVNLHHHRPHRVRRQRCRCWSSIARHLEKECPSRDIVNGPQSPGRWSPMSTSG